MRIKVGIASADLRIYERTGPYPGLLIVRTDSDTVFFSRSSVASRDRFIAAVHTEWITIPSEVNSYFSELNSWGRNLFVRLEGVPNSSRNGAMIRAKLITSGSVRRTFVQQVRGHGGLEKSVEARASMFFRTTTQQVLSLTPSEIVRRMLTS